MPDTFDPSHFFSQSENVALNVAAGDLFTTFTRSLDLPAQWAALVTSESGDRAVVCSGDVVTSDGAETVLFVRTSPVEVSIDEEGFASSEGFSFSVQSRVPLTVIADKSDLVSLLNHVVGSRRVAQTKHLADYLRPAIRAALTDFIASRQASAISGAGGGDEAVGAITDALKGPCFSAGLSLRSKPAIRFESKGHADAVRVRAVAATRRSEHDAGGQIDQALARARSQKLDRLAGDIQRLTGLAAETPEADLPQLLQAFSQHQRGELYEALFACDVPATSTKWIVVASGDEVLFFDPRETAKVSRRVTVAGEAGPVRSLHARHDGSGANVLWLGAATGVYRLPVNADQPDLTLPAENAPKVRGGFNSVAVSGERVFATHSELGFYEWAASCKESGKRRFSELTRDASAVRCAVVHDDDVYFSLDDRVVRFALGADGDEIADEYRGSDSTITAIHVNDTALFAGNASGDLLSWPLGAKGSPQRLHQGMKRAVESIWLSCTGGVRRLVYTDTSSRVYARVLGDSFTCHYEAGGQTLRRVEVADDLMVATNELRDRLLLWTPGDPKKPQSVISISSLTGRSVQDVCLV